MSLETEDSVASGYVRTLSLNPTHSSAWLGLSEVLLEAGAPERASAALDRALELSPLSIAFLWDSSILAFRLGRVDEALERLSVVAAVDDRRRGRVFEVVWDVVGDPQVILDEVVTDKSLIGYYNFLLHRNKAEEALMVWPRVRAHGEYTPGLAHVLVSRMLGSGRVSDALDVWNGAYGADGWRSGVWNGGFEAPLLNAGFGWTVGNHDWVSITLDSSRAHEGKRSIKLSFYGSVGFHGRELQQTLPVEPGARYSFDSHIATSGLGDITELRWVLSCEGLSESTEALSGTRAWTPVGVEFEAPEGCGFVVAVLEVKRRRGMRQRHGGEAWIDSVVLRRAESGE